jgi:two-component system sensor histidine kinase DesK
VPERATVGPMTFRPPATAHDGLQGKWAWGWAFASVWLLYLADAVIAAAENDSVPLAVLGVVAILAFGLLYVWSFNSVRSYRRQGRLLPARIRYGVIGASLGLLLVAAAVAGERALAMLVFISVMVMFTLPLRTAAPVVAALVATAEIAPRTVPGWEPADMLGFQVAITALAMWGVTQLVQRNAQLAAAQQELAELAVTNERTRFARDLHDILGHSLTVLTVKAELAGRLVRLDPDRAEREIAEVERLGRDALADVRAAVAGYRGSSLAAELVSARAALDAAGIEAALPTAVDEVPGERRELLGWAVREGVTNVVRHSGAEHCWIRLSTTGVEIADDGRGPVAAAADEHGHGLTGLRERAEAAGASLVLGRAEEGGFRLRVGW